MWDAFRFIFRQLQMTFFHKIMVEHNATYDEILQMIKQFLNLKVIKLEKIK